ncbi:MAG: peptide deformylase, partial [Erysipelotrichaceae bacterium]|nr:peptide deformylase [Erysipelotrichaceae bacterium]
MLIDSAAIVLDGNPVLREKAAEVTLPLSPQDRETLTEMLEYVRNSHDEQFCEEHNVRASVGIAAPQIAVSKRMLAVSIQDEDKDIEFAL